MVKSAVHINHARWEKAPGYGNEAEERFHEKCWVRCSSVPVTFPYLISFLPFFPHLFPSSLFLYSFVPLSSPHFSSSFTFDLSALPHFFTPVTGKMWLVVFLLPGGSPTNTLCWLVCACEIHILSEGFRSYEAVQGNAGGAAFDWTWRWSWYC